MPKSLTTSENNVLRPEDFDQPLKRKEATVPGYWMIDELSAETGYSVRKIQYDIAGNPKSKTPSKLKGYKAGPTFLVPDAEALAYIKQHRTK